MTAPVTRFDAERAVHLSLGVMSPLWPAYFVAASSGMALWWLSRLTSPLVAATPKVKPVASLPPPIEIDAVVDIPKVSAPSQAAPKPMSKPPVAETPAQATPTVAAAAKPAPKAKPAAPKPAAASAPRASAKQPTSKV